MKNKNNLALFNVLSILSVLATISSILFANPFANSSNADNVYNIVCNKNQNKFNSSTSIFKTELKNKVKFLISGVYTAGGNNWLSICKGAKFSNFTDIRCLTSITFNFASAGSFDLYYSKDTISQSENINFSEYWKETYTVTANQILTVDVPAKALHFSFESKTDYLLISSMIINFDCEDSTTWDNENGVNPIINEEANTLTYGLFPRKHINDETLIKNLEYKATLVNALDEQPFWYKDGTNDGFYVRDIGNPKDSGNYFSTGVELIRDAIYYFKCEPIIWNIISSGENYVIDCSYILYSSLFDSYNVYKYSDLRTYLNDNFYKEAFFLNNSHIVKTKLDDVEIEGDYVYVGSASQYVDEWYKNNDERKKQVTDFALCNYVRIFSIGYAYYWTRSTLEQYENKIYPYAINYDGVAAWQSIDTKFHGASPSLTIKI